MAFRHLSSNFGLVIVCFCYLRLALPHTIATIIYFIHVLDVSNHKIVMDYRILLISLLHCGFGYYLAFGLVPVKNFMNYAS